jgi:hypothetical protein
VCCRRSAGKWTPQRRWCGGDGAGWQRQEASRGQLFIFYTIRRLGPVVFTVIMTTRPGPSDSFQQYWRQCMVVAVLGCFHQGASGLLMYSRSLVCRPACWCTARLSACTPNDTSAAAAKRPWCRRAVPHRGAAVLLRRAAAQRRCAAPRRGPILLCTAHRAHAVVGAGPSSVRKALL